MQISGLDHFVLRVADLERALGFYRDILGLPVLFMEEFRAGVRPFVSVRVGEQLLDLVPDPNYDAAAGARAGGYLHCCFQVQGSLDDVIPQLTAQGVELLDPQPAVRMGATGWGRSIYIRDPDGYVVELKETTAPQ